MAYAGVDDITLYGLPATALGTLTTNQKEACLAAAAAEMDSHFRARYTLPFVTYGVELTEKNVIIGKYKMLMVRGFNPQAASDKAMKDDYDAAILWCIGVKEQKIHPDVTSNETLDAVQPLVYSNTPRGY